MALVADISTYGGIKVNEEPIEHFEGEDDADDHNRQAEDTAHLTRTSARAIVKFTCTAAGNPTVADGNHRSHWGTGAGQKPTVTRTGAGRYTITYASSYVDALGQTESVSLTFAAVRNATTANVADNVYAERLTVSGNVVTILVQSPKGTNADAGNSSATLIEVEVEVA